MKNLSTKLSALLLALALGFTLVACGGNEVPANESSLPEATEAATSLPEQTPETTEKPGTDRAGNAITVPDEVGSIISMAPATTQVLVDLGLADAIVAFDNNSAIMYPEMDIAVFDLYSPDVEQILVLEADIIFTSPMSGGGAEDPFTQLVEQGQCVASIPTPDDISGIFADVRFIAACVGLAAEGEALLDSLQATMDEVAAIAAGIEEKRTVLFEISELPYIYSFGTGVYLDEVITLIGAENAMGTEQGWIPVAEEAAVAANPDVIMTNVSYIEDAVGEILGREGWQQVAAVANEDVYYIDNNASSLPNHHVAEAIVAMAKAVYPEAYATL